MSDALAELYVTNFHKRFTGVSATADAVVSRQAKLYDMRLVGLPLPSLQSCCSYLRALGHGWLRPSARPFAIWHVRRNVEMLAALFARDLLRLPIKTVFTSAAQRRHSPFPRALIARMDAVVATTAKAASFVPKVAGIVPHGVDIVRFQPADDRSAAWRELNLPGRYGIGIVGRIRPEKGTDAFVECMCRILPQRPDFTAVVIGRAKASEAEFETRLRSQVIRYGLGDRIHFVGELPSTRMPDVMRGLSLLVAPPRYEGYGMTCLEAMASGVAVVATNTGCFGEVIQPQKTGAVVPVGDTDALTEQVLQLTAQPDQLHQMGQAAREHAVEHLSLEREVQGYAAIYQQLWSSHRI